MLTGPCTGCSKTRWTGNARQRCCFTTQAVGRAAKRVPFQHYPVPRVIAHLAKPTRTTAPRLAAHPVSRQISNFARYTSTEQSSSAQMEGSGQGPVLKDVVLLGGGHSHVEVLRRFGMDPMPGVRVTLITKDVHTPYSGMLPGLVAGFYTFDECHIDLAQLCTFASARLIHAEAIGIDKQSMVVMLPKRPPIAFDVLSVDIGITPSKAIPGSSSIATPVKPISGLVDRFNRLLDHATNSEKPLQLCVVGGGAGGVEISLALNHRLKSERQKAGKHEEAKCSVSLFSKGQILQGHTPAARHKLLRLAQEEGVEVREGVGIKQVQEGRLVLEDGAEQPFDECLWCTQASAPAWLTTTGLQTDELGFLSINEYLQAASGPPNIFAVGDVATSTVYPRPKAGVFAVRQGPPLTDNIRRFLQGENLKAFKPQTSWLSLITSGSKYAVATKGWFCLEGAWLWPVKDYIDRKFMSMYSTGLDQMEAKMAASAKPTSKAKEQGVAAAAGPEALAAVSAAKMRCGGCGGKVGASILSRVLQRLPRCKSIPGESDILVGLDAPDDAAVIRPPPAGHVMVQTVDFFRSFVDDPYVFGAIAANHALGDCHAMGAQAQTALAVAVVPYGLDSKMEEELFQMLAGAFPVLQEAGCALVGGHTCEGQEASLGFSVTGIAQEGSLMSKSGMQAGQAIILTKPLGTGTIMAAAMRRRAKGRWITGALSSMQQSSAEAARILKDHEATACTDVTGFGLVSAAIDTANIPMLDGAMECLAAGVMSSMHSQNAKASAEVTNAQQAIQHETWPLMVDPQTGGGLLASLPQDKADLCVQALHKAGYSEAAIIGQVTEGSGKIALQHQQNDKPVQNS
ncbi:MAG: water dikinase [Trebouxia sp. A1-2]|nr:MAG: water dikinase [Trebouxia sp. A1-2]